MKMTTKSKSGIWHLMVCIIVFSWCLNGCTSFEAITNYLNSTDHFLVFKDDTRILYESGAEKIASAVSAKLPSAISKVESRMNAAFPDKITIYVCKSPESFKEMTGRDVAAMAYRKSIFLSPKLSDEPHTLNSYIAHELTHLYMYQHMGGYGYLCIPSWFHEGLAAFISDGGGAEKVSDAETKEAIRSGNHFLPLEKAGLRDLFVPKYASYWGINHPFKHHMFYHQCMLFIAFLEEENPVQFKEFLNALRKNTDFSEAFRTFFETDTMSKWKKFKHSVSKS